MTNVSALNTQTKWMLAGEIHNFSVIGRDTIFFGYGCHLMFINIITNETQVYPVNLHSVNGEGISCLTGHKTMPFFAYSESCSYANIYIIHYPSFDKLSVLADGPMEGYARLAFSDQSQLVSLSNLPRFAISIWNWRKGQKIAEKLSTVQEENQILRCNLTKPLNFVQMGVNSQFINVWDCFMSCKKCVLIQHNVRSLNNEDVILSDAIYGNDNTLYVLSANGCIYVLTGHHCLKQIIAFQEKINLSNAGLSMIYYRNGLMVKGPDKLIQYFKKQTGGWELTWTIEPEKSIRRIVVTRSDMLIGITYSQEIIVFNTESGAIEKSLLENHNCIVDVCLINPLGCYCIVFRKDKTLHVREVATSKLTSVRSLTESAQVVVSNPEYPYVAIGHSTGFLELISVYLPDKIQTMALFNLTSDPIDSIKFSDDGKVIVAGYMATGSFFIVKGVPGTQMEVIAYITTELQIVDYIVVPSRDCCRLFMIPVTTNQLAGNKIIRKCILEKEIRDKEFYFEDSEFLVYSIVASMKPNRDRVFYVLSVNSKFIYEMETKRGDNTAKIIKKIPSGHQLKRFSFHLTKFHAITWGLDGFVLVRDNSFKKPVAVVLAHHRNFRGVKTACMDRLGKYVVSLGFENFLICTDLQRKEDDIDRDLENDILHYMKSDKLALMFKRKTGGFIPTGELTGKNWVQASHYLELKQEEEYCRKQRNALMAELSDIQKSLKKLITKNLNGPENEKIDLIEFNLDMRQLKARKLQNEEDCKHAEIYYKQLIVAQDKVFNWMKETLWEPSVGKPQSMKAIYGDMFCSKYTIWPLYPDLPSRTAILAKHLKIEEQILEGDCFRPWIAKSRDELEFLLSRPPNIAEVEPTLQLTEESNANQDTEISLYGSVTPWFINKVPGHVGQIEMCTFYQWHMQKWFSRLSNILLKEEFNKDFAKLYEQKERDMELILEKNARLRHIVSEINYFSTKKLDVTIEDPEWNMDENPENILKVFDHELTVTPYLSPSELDILKAKEEEAERIRLLLLADDFRERALMVMMNGVLEIRWEDELRKDVPQPKCMIEMDPMDYKEEELRAIKDYEEKVILLNSERERYKKLLANEYGKTGHYVREIVRKFNKKLLDLILFKTEIEMSCIAEEFRVHRMQLNLNKRVRLTQEEENLIQSMKENYQIMHELQTVTDSLTKEIHDCRNMFENTQLREKILDKSFRRDIGECSNVVQDAAFKLYKKRPKVNIRFVSSITALYELARCVPIYESSVLLPQECIDYLKALDTLDMFVGVAPNIDENLYSIICKHRRYRIEHEIKVKAMQMELAEGDITIASFQKNLSLKKEKAFFYNEELERVRAERLKLIHNVQLQFIIRNGLIEIPLNGEMEDFKDAMITSKAELESVNQRILEEGEKKLDTMKQNTAFHRKLMSVEWYHKKLRMHINDFVEKLRDIDNSVVTKELQMYLKAKNAGFMSGSNTYELQLEILGMTYENDIKDKKEKIFKMKRQLKKLKEHNKVLDQAISDVNVEVCLYNLQFDREFSEEEKKFNKERFGGLIQRTNLLQLVQKNHHEILMLQTELELLRLKTYPTFKYKVLS